jgi:hypothetical protein
MGLNYRLRYPHPSDNEVVLRCRATDDRGRLIPLSEAEIRERNAEAIRALEEMASLTDETDTPEVWADVFRGIDAARPHRRQFEGMY